MQDDAQSNPFKNCSVPVPALLAYIIVLTGAGVTYFGIHQAFQQFHDLGFRGAWSTSAFSANAITTCVLVLSSVAVALCALSRSSTRELVLTDRALLAAFLQFVSGSAGQVAVQILMALLFGCVLFFSHLAVVGATLLMIMSIACHGGKEMIADTQALAAQIVKNEDLGHTDNLSVQKYCDAGLGRAHGGVLLTGGCMLTCFGLAALWSAANAAFQRTYYNRKKSEALLGYGGSGGSGGFWGGLGDSVYGAAE